MTELRPEIQKCLQLAETMLEQALRCDGPQRVALCEAAIGAFVTAAALVPVLQESAHYRAMEKCVAVADSALTKAFGAAHGRAELCAVATEALQAAAMIAMHTEEQKDRVEELTHRLRKLIPEA